MRMLILALVLVSSVAHAGTFNVIESQPKPERVPYGSTTTPMPPVQIYDIDYAVVSRTETVTWGWKVEVRASGRSSCYVEIEFLNEDGYRVDWDNANTVVGSHSNGFTTARGRETMSWGQARRVESTNATVRCH